jgi:hypothetical protein
MKDSHLILLLQIINAETDIKALQKKGLSFSQIAQLISDSIDKGYVIREKGSLRLSKEGLEKMRESVDSTHSRKDGGWISPIDEFQIDRWSLDDIYLPPEEDSYFKS